MRAGRCLLSLAKLVAAPCCKTVLAQVRFAFLALSQAKVKGKKIGRWLVSISNILTIDFEKANSGPDRYMYIHIHIFICSLEARTSWWLLQKPLNGKQMSLSVLISAKTSEIGRKHGAVFFVVDMVDGLVDNCQHRSRLTTASSGHQSCVGVSPLVT